MNILPVILIYLFLTAIEAALLHRKKENGKIIVYSIVMLIAFILSINIIKGTNMPSIASITRKIFLPLLK